MTDGAVTTSPPAPAASAPSAAWRWLAGGLAILFGLASIAQGGRTLFGGAAARAAEGDLVPFVLMFNFAAGFAYVAAGVLAIAARDAAVWVARALAVSTLLVFAALGVHVLRGEPYEARTVAVMTLRSTFWIVQALVLARLLRGGRRS